VRTVASLSDFAALPVRADNENNKHGFCLRQELSTDVLRLSRQS